MKDIFLKTIVAATLLLMACTKKEAAVAEVKLAKDEVELTDAQYKNAGIVLGKTEQRDLSGYIKVNGKLHVPPQNMVSMSVPYGGVVKETILLEGLRVHKGQVLAVLEHPDFIQLQQDYLDSYSKLQFADLDYKRQTQLQQENVNASKTLQQAQAEYESLKARVGGLEQKLQLLHIAPTTVREKGISSKVNLYAPTDGYITQVNVNIGTYVTANAVICNLLDSRHLHVELSVFEKDIASVKVGQSIKFTISNSGKEHDATVYLIGKEIAPDRTVRVHCHMNKEDASLLPGMFIKANIQTKSSNVQTLPTQAVVQFMGKNFIYVFKNKANETTVFEMYEVEVGIADQDYTQVTLPENIATSDKIVTKGAYDLLSKMNNSEEE
jgi:membrane fusion protein, heavy metal efflux system